MSEKARPFLFKTGSTTFQAPRLKFANGTLTFTAGEAVYTAPSGGGGGGGAPTDAQYLTLATDATLTQERTISLTLPLSGSDGGAGAAYTVTLSGWSGTTDGDLLFRDGTAVGSKTASQARTWLSLVVGTNVQAWDADLDTFAALATDGVLIRSTTWQIATLTAPLQRSGATLSVAAASTSAAGIVELATDGETGSAVVVTGSDSRLASSGGASTSVGMWAGTGAGGNITLDGSTAVSWGTWSTIGGVRTLTVTFAGYIEYDTITISYATYSSIAIVTKGLVIVARTLTDSGTGTLYIDWNGGDASGSTAGAAAAQVSTNSPLYGGTAGGAGRASAGAGVAGTAHTSGLQIGGIGGTGGSAGATGGGAGGTFSRDYTPGASGYGPVSDLVFYARAGLWANPANLVSYSLAGGSGGGGGANQSTGTSGGGGGGAGAILCRFAKINVSNPVHIRAIGGTGAAGVAASGAGTSAGGAGGGAGSAMLVAGSVTGTVYVKADGGPGGNGTTLDADVAAGGVGGGGGLAVCFYGSGTAPTVTASGGTGGTGSNGAAAATGTTGSALLILAAL